MEMNGVSQKAHFMMESELTTASLQAQLKARIAPGVLLVEVVVSGTGVEPCGAERLGRGGGWWVSVLSQSFWRAARG